jgi:hypothetical protein
MNQSFETPWAEPLAVWRGSMAASAWPQGDDGQDEECHRQNMRQKEGKRDV